MPEVESRIRMNAPLSLVWELAQDVEKLPDIMPDLDRARVLAAYSLNNPKVMRYEPPLTIADAEVEWAARAFDEAVAQTAELVEDLDIEEEEK